MLLHFLPNVFSTHRTSMIRAEWLCAEREVSEETSCALVLLDRMDAGGTTPVLPLRQAQEAQHEVWGRRVRARSSAWGVGSAP